MSDPANSPEAAADHQIGTSATDLAQGGDSASAGSATAPEAETPASGPENGSGEDDPKTEGPGEAFTPAQQAAIAAAVEAEVARVLPALLEKVSAGLGALEGKLKHFL